MKNYWESERLRLRAFEEKDLLSFISKRNNPDSIQQWYEDFIPFPSSEKEIRESLEKEMKEFYVEDKRFFVMESLEGEAIGHIMVWHTDRKNGVFRYGIAVDDDFRGKGFAKEGLIIVMDYYFNELNYQKASPTAYSFNKNSQRFHEKFGFMQEGRLRNDVYTRGAYHDMIYYGMLKSEFNAKYKHSFVDLS